MLRSSGLDGDRRGGEEGRKEDEEEGLRVLYVEGLGRGRLLLLMMVRRGEL